MPFLQMSLSNFCQRWIWPLGASFYGIGFLVLLRLAYLGQLPTWLNRIPNVDKPLHVLLYAIATYLGHRVLQGKCWRITRLHPGWAIPLFPLVFALFTTAEELSQGLSPNRSLDGLDLICSLVGCWMGYRLAERHLNNKGIAKTPQ